MQEQSWTRLHFVVGPIARMTVIGRSQGSRRVKDPMKSQGIVARILEIGLFRAPAARPPMEPDESFCRGRTKERAWIAEPCPGSSMIQVVIHASPGRLVLGAGSLLRGAFSEAAKTPLLSGVAVRESSAVDKRSETGSKWSG